MFLTGFADEASTDIKKQIEATKILGWNNIELRKIGDKNLSSIDEKEFEDILQILNENEIKINCFGSGIANWQCHPRSEEDFQKSITELKNAIPRMKKLGTKLVRGMSFLTPKDESFDNPNLEKIIYKKVKHLVNICEDNGLIYGHENCMNYGGQSYIHTLKLIENINSKAFSLIFDTGNPTFTFLRIGDKPYQLQNSFEFYSNVKEFISYVHIKDANSIIKDNGEVETKYTFAGDGHGCVEEIVTDLIKNGYDGGFSIEPHLATVFHAEESNRLDETKNFETYIEYGRKFEKLLNKIKMENNSEK